MCRLKQRFYILKPSSVFWDPNPKEKTLYFLDRRPLEVKTFCCNRPPSPPPTEKSTGSLRGSNGRWYGRWGFFGRTMGTLVTCKPWGVDSVGAIISSFWLKVSSVHRVASCGSKTNSLDPICLLNLRKRGRGGNRYESRNDCVHTDTPTPKRDGNKRSGLLSLNSLSFTPCTPLLTRLILIDTSV